MTQIHRHRYDNGLELLVEPIDHVASGAMTLLLPAGVAFEPEDQQGVAAVLTEMLHRGAGDLDARQHSDALDALGVHRSIEPGTLHTRLGATFMGDQLDQVLPLLIDMVRRPALDPGAFEPARQLALQAIESLDDEPQQRAMVELKRAHLGDPIGRSGIGLMGDVQKLTAEQTTAFWQNHFVPDQTILALAGNVNFEQARQTIGDLIETWEGRRRDVPTGTQPPASATHIHANATQQHIGLAHPAVGEMHPDSLNERLAVAVLSGGMGGRLFTEVREERGLCYAVYASYWALRDTGAIFAYAGTTAARAAETLQVLGEQLQKMTEGVGADEFERARTGLLARVVMQGESTAARAAAIANDTALRGEPRTLDQLNALIDGANVDDLNRFLKRRGPVALTQLSIGPEPLG